jgi:hypothetical protein
MTAYKLCIQRVYVPRRVFSGSARGEAKGQQIASAWSNVHERICGHPGSTLKLHRGMP